MKIEVERLQKALAFVSRTTSNMMPIMTCVQVDIEQNAITFTTTNGEQSSICELHVEHDDGDCSFVVPYEVLSKYIQLIPRGIISFRRDATNENADLIIGETKLNTAPSYDFPVIPVLGDLITELPAEVINDAFSIGFSAAGKDRATLMGIHVSTNNGLFRAASTNGLITSIIGYSVESQAAFAYMLPVSIGSIPKFRDTVSIYDQSSRGMLQFVELQSDERRIIMTRTLEDKFSMPTINRVLNQNMTGSVTVQASELIRAIELAAVVSGRVKNEGVIVESIIVQCIPTNGRLTVSNYSVGAGVSNYDVPILGTSGASFIMCMNALIALPLLRRFSNLIVTIWNGSDYPILVVRSKGNYTGMISPINIDTRTKKGGG